MDHSFHTHGDQRGDGSSQVLGVTAVAILVWVGWGYSLAFDSDLLIQREVVLASDTPPVLVAQARSRTDIAPSLPTSQVLYLAAASI